MKNFLSSLEEHEEEIMDAYLSEEIEQVSHFVGGYIVRQILNKNPCESCKNVMVSSDNDSPQKYLEELSRGGIVVPSGGFSRTVESIFAQLDYLQKFVPSTAVRKLSFKALEKYAPHSIVSCDNHHDSNRKKTITTIINIFFIIIYRN